MANPCVMPRRQAGKLDTIIAKLDALCAEVRDARTLAHLQDAQRCLTFASRRVEGLDG